MIFAVIAISLVIGFVVAAGVVGSQAARLGRQRREPVWRLAEAAEFVGEELPFEVSASLGVDELEALLRGHLNQLQFAGPSGSAEAFETETWPTRDVDVTEEGAASAELYRWARGEGLEVSLDQATAVAAAHLDYLRLIGALAPID